MSSLFYITASPYHLQLPSWQSPRYAPHTPRSSASSSENLCPVTAVPRSAALGDSHQFQQSRTSVHLRRESPTNSSLRSLCSNLHHFYSTSIKTTVDVSGLGAPGHRLVCVHISKLILHVSVNPEKNMKCLSATPTVPDTAEGQMEEFQQIMHCPAGRHSGFWIIISRKGRGCFEIRHTVPCLDESRSDGPLHQGRKSTHSYCDRIGSSLKRRNLLYRIYTDTTRALARKVPH